MPKIVKIGNGRSLRTAGLRARAARTLRAHYHKAASRTEKAVTNTVADSTMDPSEREFGPSGIGLSPYRFPTGWFIVGFASDLPPGQVTRVHYFGEELVVFRTES